MAAGPVPRETIVNALDVARLDELARLAELAASYWRSVALAADRGDALTVTVHCKQIAAVTRDAFALARALGIRGGRVAERDEPGPRTHCGRRARAHQARLSGGVSRRRSLRLQWRQAYPRGFTDWPLERRNAWFAGFNVGYCDRKRGEAGDGR